MSARPQYVYTAKVVEVVDGDTLRLDLDLGLRMRSVQPVRLAGVDCPEHGTAAGDAATGYVRSLLQPGDTVTVATRKPDKYGRVLGSVDVDGTDLATTLIRLGHGRPYDGGAKAAW